VPSCVLPNSFNRVELGTVGRKKKHFNTGAMFLVPIIYLRLLVIRGIVQNEIDTVLSFVERRKKFLFEKGDIRIRVEVGGLMAILELPVE